MQTFILISSLFFSINMANTVENKTEQATFGAGCFWCVEAVFQQLEGVIKVESGYSGGAAINPTYQEVCTGKTGHAEVVQITFDPGIISFKKLLRVFWTTHDPTTLNRQGADVGTQYRSAIFYHNEDQKNESENLKEELNSPEVFDGEIVTEINVYTDFYKAENYHQNYYQQNKNQPYCQLVINPKLEKLKKHFSSLLKSTK